jgi:tetratricopeptide (TPR) repeat protein
MQRSPIELGLLAQKAGRLEVAETHYREALRLKADDPDALHLLGLCHHRRGDNRAAIDLLTRSIALAPLSAPAIANLGNVLQESGHPAEALSCFDRAVALLPGNPDLLMNRGNALRLLGRTGESIDCYRDALRLAPKSAGILLSIGVVLQEVSRLQEAMTCFEAATAIAPELALAHFNLGVLLAQAGRPADAIARFHRALEIDPGRTDALRNAALAFLTLERADEALAAIEQALRVNPNQSRLHLTHGTVLKYLGRIADAATSYQTAARLDPGDFEAAFHHAAALLRLRRTQDALEELERASRIDPTDPDAVLQRAIALREAGRWKDAVELFERGLASSGSDSVAALRNRGLCLHELHRHAEAMDSLDAALSMDARQWDLHELRSRVLCALGRFSEARNALANARHLNPHDPKLEFSEACLQLLMGDFERGLVGYEARWKEPWYGLKPGSVGRAWTGTEALDGRVVLLQCEQGLGDALQFCRYATLVAARGAVVRLEVHPSLVRLMRSLEGVEGIYEPGASPPGHDLAASLMSLPAAFGTRIDSIPCRPSYLGASPDLIASWRERMGPRLAQLRIGLAWSGNQQHVRDGMRSIPLRLLEPLSSRRIEWISLQKEVRSKDREAFNRIGIRGFEEALTDFAETAALLANLDLVISVDTSVAHLAGAVGIPVWILLDQMPDWRWLLERADSPWYPSARLFRQKEFGNWPAVVAQVAEALQVSGSPFL